MKRRGFFKALAGLAVAPVATRVAAAFPAASPLLNGEIGRYEGFTFVESAAAPQVWAVNGLGGFMYSTNLSDELIGAVKGAPKVMQWEIDSLL